MVEPWRVVNLLVCIVLLLCHTGHCIDFWTSIATNNETRLTHTNLTCSVTESNIRTLIYIKISAQTSLNVKGGEKTTSTLAVTTTTGTLSYVDQLPVEFRDVDITGHINNTYFKDSQLSVTGIPCTVRDVEYTCEILYMISESTEVVSSNKTLKHTKCTHAIGRSMDSGSNHLEFNSSYLIPLWMYIVWMFDDECMWRWRG